MDNSWSSAGLADIILRLRASGSVFAEEEAALLVAEATDAVHLESLVSGRVDGQPLEYLVGWAEFAGIRMHVEPGVFVPRHRTEFLVREAVARGGDAPRVLDLCCGTGALGAVILAAVPGAELVAADIDPAAVRSARLNLPAGTRVYEGDLFAAIPGELRGWFDVIVANTPYVPTDAIALMPPEARLHEARWALDGGSDGLDLQRRVAGEAPVWLAPGGWLFMEASEHQAPVSAGILTAAGLEARVDYSDDFESTVVSGRLPVDPSSARR